MKPQPSYLPSVLQRLALPTLVFVCFASAFFSKTWYLSPVQEHSPKAYSMLLLGLGLSLWLSGAYFIDQCLRILFFDIFLQRTLGRSVPDILKSIFSIVISFLALVGILKTVFHFEISGVWTTSGVAGIILGIALRPLIADVFSGLASNIEGAFHIGEWVTLDPGRAANQSYAGWVEEIRWRTTRIRNREGNICIIPNSMIATSIIINHALPLPWHRFSLTLILDHTIDTKRACRILEASVLAAVSDHEGPIRLPGPEVRITKLDDLGVHYALLFWGDPSRHSPYVLNDRVLKSAYLHLNKAGITVSQYRKQIIMEKQFQGEEGDITVSPLRFLKNLSLFQGFNHQDLQTLAERLILHHYPRGHNLVEAGAEGDSMFILNEGLLEVEGKLDNGSPVRLGQLVPGDFFGEMSLLTGVPRSARVFAVVESSVYEIKKTALKPMLEKDTLLLDALSKALAERQARNADTRAHHKKDSQLDLESHSLHILDRIKDFFHL